MLTSHDVPRTQIARSRPILGQFRLEQSRSTARNVVQSIRRRFGYEEGVYEVFLFGSLVPSRQICKLFAFLGQFLAVFYRKGCVVKL